VRSPGQSFVARLELQGMADGQYAGLMHFSAQLGQNPAASAGSVGVVMDNGRRFVAMSRDGAYTRLQEWPHSALWVKSAWGLDGKATFSVSADGLAFQPVGEPFQLTWGAYRGSRLGLLTFNPSGERGYVDIDHVQYPVNREASADQR
jgi:hypothetical protein